MVKKELEKIIQDALEGLSISESDFVVERPLQKGLADYATNAAIYCAKKADKNPKDLAQEIVSEIEKQKSDLISKIEIAGPGFINFFLSESAIIKEISLVEEKVESGFDFRKSEKINMEFISANPTGDLHIGHGRGAFYGDILSNILSFGGADVVREYYINDSRESVQIKELGKTAIGSGEQYKTEKLEKMISNMNFSGMSEEDAGATIAGKIQEENKNFIESKLGIKFDVWYSEDEKLRASGANDKMLDGLKNFTEKKEGEGDALWLKTSEYGDDEDRIIVRSDGSKSYFISDIAYHADKFTRGFDTVIDVWGADHHGHVKRIMAVKEILEWEGELKIFITQLVSLKEGGVFKKMSKRAGTVILLEELVEEFGIDVVRWFFAEKSLNTHMEFDMELARERSAKNPVYYVQYAHARIASILENTKNLKPDNSSIEDVIKTKAGRDLASKIMQFPEIIENISKEYQVHKLTTYLHELSSEFSQFYRDVRVVKEEEYDAGALALAMLAKKTIAKGLFLLGISAPEKM